jgi:hypothetical protein
VVTQVVPAQKESWLAASAAPLARVAMFRVVLSELRRT